MNLEQALKAIEEQPISRSVNPKLAELWEKIRPMVYMLGMIFGRKVKPYINAFIAAIDEITADELVEGLFKGPKKATKKKVA